MESKSDSIRRLKQVVEFDNTQIEVNLNYILDKTAVSRSGNRKSILFSGIRGLMFIHTHRWIYNLYVDNDTHTLKQNLFTCGLLQYFILNKDINELRHYGHTFEYLTYLMLSDETDLYNKYVKTIFNNIDIWIKDKHAAPLYAFFSLDFYKEDEAAQLISKIYLEPKNPVKKYKYELEVIYALLEKDQTRLEKVLNEMLSGRISGRRDTMIQDYIYLHVTCYTKIAWRLGMEIDIQHDKVPMELMPIEPLEKYEIPYDFLKDIISNNTNEN